MSVGNHNDLPNLRAIRTLILAAPPRPPGFPLAAGLDTIAPCSILIAIPLHLHDKAPMAATGASSSGVYLWEAPVSLPAGHGSHYRAVNDGSWLQMSFDAFSRLTHNGKLK